MTKKMLIDATHPEETRVVVVDGNKVDNFDFESINKKQLAGNIYLAKVTRVEPSLQAAFVDYGGNRHGFLAFSEIHPDYYQIPVADREALLAEEEREARAEARAEDPDAETAPPKRARRSRKPKSASAAQPSAAKEAEPAAPVDTPPDETAEPSGAAPPPKRARRRGPARRSGNAESLAVIDLDGQDEAAGTDTAEPAPKGLEIAGTAAAPEAIATDAEPSGEGEAPQPAAEPATPEPDVAAISGPAAEPEPAEKPEPEPATDPGQTVAGAGAEPAPPPPATGSDETGSETQESGDADAPDTGPRSMAESAGLDDEVVAEDVAAEGEAKGERRSRTRRGRGRAAKAGSEDETRTRPARTNRNRRSREDAAEEDEPAPEAEDIESAGAEDIREEVSRERAIRRRRYKIQDVVKVRQILLVQVVKEERGNKGAALTTYLSLAGRYCVLMPNTARGGGISRKITNAPDRKRLREVVGELDVPKGMGLIVRTAGAERTRPEIKRDYEFLLRQWEQIRDLTLKSIAPTLIYEEGSLIKRSIRDLYSKEIESVVVEGEAGYREAKDYMKMLMPSHARNVKQYADPIPLFIRYQVESYLNAMFSPVVQLKSGGYIVIGVTEALVAIDVNSGRSTKEGSVEDTAVKTNLEAADEVARQLRLRDLAGLIVIDFIDMDERRNNAAVEKRMKERLKTDRARIQLGRISAFGLMEMSRQRLRPGMLEASTRPCPHCHGTGMIRSDDSLSLAILREVEEQAIRDRAAEVTVTTPVEIANFLINAKRAHIAQIESRHGVQIAVFGDPGMLSPNFSVERSATRPREAEPRQAAVTAETGAAAAVPESAAEPAPPEPARESRPAEAEDDGSKSRKRRGRRGGKRRRNRPEGAEGGEAAESAQQAADEAQQGEAEAEADAAPDAAGSAPEPEAAESKPRRSRGGRGRRSGERRGEEDAVATADSAAEGGTGETAAEAVASDEAPSSGATPDAGAAESADTDRPGMAPEAAPATAPATTDEPMPASATAGSEAGPDPRTEPNGAATSGEAGDTPGETAPEPTATEPPPQKPKRRGWWTLGF